MLKENFIKSRMHAIGCFFFLSSKCFVMVKYITTLLSLYYNVIVHSNIDSVKTHRHHEVFNIYPKFQTC